LIAKEHGHRILTMLTVYVAWTEGAVEADFWAIHDAMYRTDLDTLRRRSVTPWTAIDPSPATEPETSETDSKSARPRALCEQDVAAEGETTGFDTPPASIQGLIRPQVVGAPPRQVRRANWSKSPQATVLIDRRGGRLLTTCKRCSLADGRPASAATLQVT
jgi:hypothetical protein